MISTSMLHYDRSTKTLSGEMSELTRGGTVSIFQRAYSDACDNGVLVVSHRTGKSVMFVEVDIARNSDGDIDKWTFKPVDKRECGNISLVIFND